MSQAVNRSDVVLVKSAAGNMQPGAAYQVTAFEVGGVVRSASSGNTVSVDLGHGFAANDKFIVNTDETIYTVGTVADDSFTLAAAGTVSVSKGDVLSNLGSDTGSGTPSYDGSGVTIYSDADAGDSIANSTVACDANGNFEYYHKGGTGIWELVRDASGTPVAINKDVDTQSDEPQIHYGKRYIHKYATGGQGTAADPWTGWETAVVEYAQNHFIAGYYGTGTGIGSNVASEGLQLTAGSTEFGETSVTGDGHESTFIIGTADVQVFRIRATAGGPPNVGQCFVSGITVRTNVTNTQANGMVSFEGFDGRWSIRNFGVHTRNAADSADLAVTLGCRFHNCQTGVVDNIQVRGESSATTSFTTGILIDADDSSQRGNIVFMGGAVELPITTAVKIQHSGTSVMNNCAFFGFKALQSTTNQAGSVAFDLQEDADQTWFYNCHIESFEQGIKIAGADGCGVCGGLIAGANDAGSPDTDGAGIETTDTVEGLTVVGVRFDDCYNALEIGAHATIEVTYIGSLVSNIGNAEVVNNSTSSNSMTQIIGGAITAGDLTLSDATTPTLTLTDTTTPVTLLANAGDSAAAFGTTTSHPVNFTTNGNTRIALSNNDIQCKIPVQLEEQSGTPASPTQGTEANCYLKDDKFIIQFDDAGTTRYKYLDLTGTGVTWVHTTTAP